MGGVLRGESWGARSLGQELHSMIAGQLKGDLLSYGLVAIDKVDHFCGGHYESIFVFFF